MKPLSIPLLVLIWLIGTGLGAQVLDVMAARGRSVPVTGWLTTVVELALIGVLLVHGLPLRRYMAESRDRDEHPTVAPRRHQIDLPTAYRTVLIARACAYTGAIVGGLFSGQALFLLVTGTGDLWSAVVPSTAAALAGTALGVLGVVVERWGTLPPQDGEGGERAHVGS